MPINSRIAASANATLIRRIQIFRKDSSTIQVYDDHGHGTGWTFDFSLEKFIPIIRLGWKGQKGKYSVRLHEVVINPDIKENPKFFDNSHALTQFLQTGSSELLNANQKPNVIKADFTDKTSRFALFAWRYKKFKTLTNFDISEREGLNGKFVSLSDEKQTGWNWEAFVKDLINFGVSRYVKGLNAGGNPFQNTAETIKGMGLTLGVRYEAGVDESGQHQERFMRLTDRWEGWSASVKKVQDKMLKINSKFGFTVFDPDSIENAKKLQLFNVSVNLNLYESGIRRLGSIPSDLLKNLERRYEAESRGRRCTDENLKWRLLSTGERFRTCGTFDMLLYQNAKCKDLVKQNQSEAESIKCMLSLFRNLYEDLTFSEITQIIGKDNIFVHGSINGFRSGEEILNDPILSNTHGLSGSKYWNGPLEVIQRMLGINSGEFNGIWMRDRL
jgi:hypothetical protein